MSESATVRVLYKKLLNLYPRGFKEQLGESMQQTFNDRYNEQKRQANYKLFGFVLWIFLETAVGIFQEHLLLLIQGSYMKNITTNPRRAAITSFILCMPLAVPYMILMYDVEPLAGILKNLFTMDSQPENINMLGRLVLLGGLLLLPVAFIINLQPMLNRSGPEQKRTLHVINLILGVVILLLVVMTWGSLIMESIYCLQGISCD